MDTISKSLLSAELQELYMQNKKWMSQILFLEDESRFLQQLFVKKQFLIDLKTGSKQKELIAESLISLEKRTITIKYLVIQHQHLLETIFKDPLHAIGITLLEEHARITLKLKELFHLDCVLKSELFAIIEEVD